MIAITRLDKSGAWHYAECATLDYLVRQVAKVVNKIDNGNDMKAGYKHFLNGQLPAYLFLYFRLFN